MITKKLITGVATLGLLTAAFAPMAFAESGVTIQGNGTNSNNTVEIENTNVTAVNQSNTTMAGTFVVVTQGTGNNSASGNTGGDVSVKSGSADSTVTTKVIGGSNTATVDNCGCTPSDPKVTVSGNSEKSVNTVEVENTNLTLVSQKATTNALTGVLVTQGTGLNKANSNTGKGTVTVKSGKATSTVTTTVKGGSNKLK
jgi:hypothetical protein